MGIPDGVDFHGIIYTYKNRPYYHMFRKPGIGFIHGKTLLISFPFKLRYSPKDGFLD